MKDKSWDKEGTVATYYEILEVSGDAGYDEIKQSYRRLVKLYHPDLNPSSQAEAKIRQLTEAYEVLADPTKRQSYDWTLLQNIPFENKVQQDSFVSEVDEREQFKRDYIRWKRKKEQEHWEQLFRIKVKFYKYQRYAAVFFLAIGLIYTIDHYVSHTEGPYTISKVTLNSFGASACKLNNKGFIAKSAFYRSLKDNPPQQGYLHRSFIFNVPAFISADGGKKYALYETLYMFNNVFAFLVIFIALLMIRIHKYSDWILTLGLIPFFLVAFLFMMTLIG